MRKCNKIEGGLPGTVHAQMVFNLAVDFLIGLIPIIGDLGDAAFRCNSKNAALLEEHLMKKHGPQNMSMKDKRRSRLEDFGIDEKKALQGAKTAGEPTRPGRAAANDHGHPDRFGPDLELGSQHTGTAARY